LELYNIKKVTMEINRLTTLDLWAQYWQGKNKTMLVDDNFSYSRIFYKLSEDLPAGSTSIELGGFPGKFSVFFKKFLKWRPTLLDYYFDEVVFNDMIECNSLAESDIKVIVSDLFAVEPTEKYDLVASFGLVEHFKDLEQILRAHMKFMNYGGRILIIIPNFRGLNGILQKFFDFENLKIHNLAIMNLAVLAKAAQEVGLSEVEVSYYDSTQVWIENINSRRLLLRLLVRFVDNMASVLGFIVGKENWFLSNSIVVSARLK